MEKAEEFEISDFGTRTVTDLHGRSRTMICSYPVFVQFAELPPNRKSTFVNPKFRVPPDFATADPSGIMKGCKSTRPLSWGRRVRPAFT